ncbi:MAG: outer membrane lipid asymmetry maintenance protein MlaD [Magnetococcales bacterium]|nr:outer membrane lipid asymmetry maintenance protein MlaD [Magnetococcales bacterium]
MRSIKLEIAVGLFVFAGILALGWLSVKLARMELVGGNYIPIHVQFTSVSGLKSGANVEIAGVGVGRVDSIDLDKDDYEARVILKIDKGVPIQEDAIASVRTKGLIGDRYIKITPGASDVVLKAGDKLIQNEPAIDFEELISQFIHGSIE